MSGEERRRKDEDESASSKSGADSDAGLSDRETAPGQGPERSEAPTTDLDFGDLVSLPGRRTPAPTPPPRPATPTPTPPPVKRKAPEVDTFFAEAATDPGLGATVPDAAAPKKAPGPGESGSDIEAERELPTQLGHFTDREGERPAEREEEAETLPIVPPTVGATGVGLVAGDSATGATARPSPSRKSPLSKAAAHTARDPIAGSQASRGSHPVAPSESHALAEGQLVADRYELLERLGKGGMGEVWKAKHILLQGTRAIKVIKASISRDPAFRQRFLHEGQTMMRVKHPGVVEVTDLDETRASRELFMVMEYLQGRTIYDAIRDKTKPLSADVTAAVKILIECAVGLQRIHDERIVHKDIKSDNVLLVKDERGVEHPKVIDFGLAKSLGDKDQAIDQGGGHSPGAPSHGIGSGTPAGSDAADMRTTLSGTLAYMSPEQFRAEPSSFQSDIYAFGVMGYELFTDGEFPLPRGSLAHYMQLHRDGGANPEILAKKRPDLDPKLSAILDRCLAPKKEDRPASFTQVAEDLQWWLDTPERERKLRQLILTSVAATALVGAAVWGVFFAGEKTASLSQLAYVGGGKPYQPSGGVVFLPASALDGFMVTAAIDGKPGEASLEVDGVAHEVTAQAKDGKFEATADLSDLADGEHKVAVRPSPGASASKFVVDVDRVAPKVKSATVRGGATADGVVYTNSQSPEVVVELDEPADHVASVTATVGGDKIDAQRDGERWLLLGTAKEDGRVDMTLTARDRAGNETTSRFGYVRDTVAPDVTVADEYSSIETGVTGREMRVRSARGATLRASAKDGQPVKALLAPEGGTPIEKPFVDGAVSIDLPELPEEGGVPAKFTARDAAGNETVREFRLSRMADWVQVSDGEMRQARAIRPKGEFVVVFIRAYVRDQFDMGARFPFVLTRTRAADGATSPARATRAAGMVFSTQNEGQVVVVKATSEGLEEGAYDVAPVLPPDAQVNVAPYRLVVDGTQPTIESWSVAEASGRVVPADGFALSPDVVVTVPVSDLSLERLTLGGASPQETFEPGRHVYTFRMRCAEGANNWPLVATDAASNASQQTVVVNADWTPPALDLEPFAPGAEFDDATTTTFKGRCANESSYRVYVALPNSETFSASFTSPEFAVKGLLPVSGVVALSVYAEDAAGHRSAPFPLTLNVRHVGKELPPEVAWRQSVTALMEQLEPGDVVIGGRVHPVSRAFVDKTEVTNAQYRAFLAAVKTSGDEAWRHRDQPKGWDHAPTAETWNDAKWNADDLPVVNVAYWDAYAFAQWSGRRLPTEAEWVKAAAKAKGEPELRQYPPFAPGEWKDGVLATNERVKGPTPVGDGGDVSPIGCLNMAGNVCEWVEIQSPPPGGSPAGTRGGSWYYGKRAADVRNTPTKAWDRSFRAPTIGFRCAVNAEKVQP